MATWSVQRLAAEVLTIPVLDFQLAAAKTEIADGAGGVAFLGSAPAPADLGARVAALVGAAPSRTHPLVMADEEGGGVSRLGPVVSPLPWPREMAQTMTPGQVRATAARAGQQMRAAGVTMDLAPVADVDDRPGPSATNPDGLRSFSGNPQTAATYTVAFAQGLADVGVVAVVKHFPGLGGAFANTDVAPAATLPLTQLDSTGLVPFRAAIAAGVPAVMVSNASTPGLTDLPTGLSSAAVSGLLDQQLGFRGMVVTDSLSVGAVLTGGRTLEQAAVQALAAGSDLILFGSTLTPAETAKLDPPRLRATFDQLVNAIANAVRNGSLSRGRLVSAALAVSAASHETLCG